MHSIISDKNSACRKPYQRYSRLTAISGVPSTSTTISSLLHHETGWIQYPWCWKTFTHRKVRKLPMRKPSLLLKSSGKWNALPLQRNAYSPAMNEDFYQQHYIAAPPWNQAPYESNRCNPTEFPDACMRRAPSCSRNLVGNQILSMNMDHLRGMGADTGSDNIAG